MELNLNVLIGEQKLQERIKSLGKEITEYYKEKTDTIHAVCVLKGAIHFFTDLVENIDLNVEYSFIHVSSYSGMESTGRIRVKSWIDEPIEGRHVLVVEDILDTGQTLSYILGYLKRYNPADLKVATLLKKTSKNPIVNAEFVGFEIEDKFVVGYGLDFDEKYRNIPYIGYLE
ncbi:MULTISPECIES: hypoxanthine phosphoribosyltransferase [Thermosipho]|jgi:hypoxanthine phosphoribosyltransferase|uniref:hypoxanthine phosphoribosyltransferase n=1 Tax=Thermosipho sp. (in: thermotogales) TaxID=1968895 RepID=UPI00186B9558|nr:MULTISPECIES: hypoxanthine phosphoribosyltransferase [Thermosipho]MBZ4650345.1 hpt hypoxanthine phosphoribosyltransferase [Thermosipho sp. (in: thermotogales)]MDK2840259.1 hypoxanthine phosphoribosyltransferase [Thermosipho sp. (in: thermotogales)]MDK2900371.1 hypoxanthine phosphoribosyltransferase [Thermosipho sp. (in: thermotogales)]